MATWITWSKLTGGLDDDYADRMSHIYTVIMLIVFAIFVTTGTYVNEPIICAYKQITRKTTTVKLSYKRFVHFDFMSVLFFACLTCILPWC